MKRIHSEDSLQPASPQTGDMGGILKSISTKLCSCDLRLALLAILQKDFQVLHESVEFRQQLLAANTCCCKHHPQRVGEIHREGMTRENRNIKDTIIELQAHSMMDSLVFSGIPEMAEEDPETTVSHDIQTYLKLWVDVVKNIRIHRVHCFEGK